MATERSTGTAELLAAAEAAAREVADAAAPEAGQDGARRLLDALYELGLCARRDPAFAASPALGAMVERTAPLLERGINVLGYWLMVLEGRFYGTWEWNWDEATRARSALEFLFELYRGTPLAARFDELGTEEVDGQLRHVAQYEGMNPDESVPPGIPASHWWWWAPEPPPIHR
jgi:hypothetical protein